jgi:hypothetical protein
MDGRNNAREDLIRKSNHPWSTRLMTTTTR